MPLVSSVGETPRMQLYDFLAALWRGGNKSYWHTKPNAQSYWFAIDDGLKAAQKKYPKARNQNIYFGIHPVSKIPPTNSRGEPAPIDRVRSQNQYISVVNCVYGDFDGVDTITTPQPPSVTVNSGGGIHAYWLLDKPFYITSDDDRQYAKKLQAQWVTHIGCDPGAKDLSRILRVPGSTNFKAEYGPDFPTVDFIDFNLDLRYSIDDLVIEEIVIDEPRPIIDTSNININHPWFATAIEGTLDDLRTAANGTRNDTLNKVAFRIGQFVPHAISESEAESLILDAGFAVGLHEGEINATMKGAIHSGMNKSDYGPQGAVAIETTNDDFMIGVDDDTEPLFEKAIEPEQPEEWKAPTTEETITAWLIKHGLGTTRTVGKLTKWKFDSCPTSHAHDDGAALSLRYGVVTYKCEHASCKHHDWWSLLAMYDGDVVITPQTKSQQIKSSLRKYGNFTLNRLEDMPEVDGNPIDDSELSEINLHMLDCGIDKKHIIDAINSVARESSYHPIKDYLDGLQYDGGSHLAEMLSYLTGDDDKIDGTPVHQVFITKWMLGCVARVLQSGEKNNPFKHQNPMLILSGEQGIGKSSWVRWLCSGIGFDYHREGRLSAVSIEDQRSMITKWIWEVSEFAIDHKTRDATKALITQENHTYRTPYAKRQITKPTLCNLVSTINPQGGILNDATGERRYMPVNIWAIDHDYAKHIDIDSVWAEVHHMYMNGASPKLTKEENQALNSARQQHRIENPLEEYIEMYFEITKDPLDTLLSAEMIKHLEKQGVRLGNSIIGAGMNLRNALAFLGIEKPKGKKFYSGIRYKHGFDGDDDLAGMI